MSKSSNTAESYRIEATDRQSACELSTETLIELARQVLAAEKAPPAEIEIAVVSDDEIARINMHYLRHEGPTDVITFDLSGNGDSIEGQIIVSADTAHRQAESHGHAMETELALYVAHGLLHLLGYDDRKAKDRKKMHARQIELLDELGFEISQ
jgi:probable rRNA maturation factor